MILEQYRQTIIHAHNWISFNPKKRADYLVKAYSEQLEEDLKLIEEHGGDAERYKEAYIYRFLKWMDAKSRCSSSAITGGSGFNVARAEKANDREHTVQGEFYQWRDKVLHKITRPESTDIVKGTDGAIDRMKEKLRVHEELQTLMKSANKIIKDKNDDKEERLTDLGLNRNTVVKLMYGSQGWWGKGYAPFTLTNNGATIRRLKKDIEAEERRLAMYEDGNKEYEHGSAKVVENVEENRLQLFFDGKPSDDIRKELKSRGFRWSPRNEAWQRQLTTNAVYALKRMSI